uniref:Tyrosine-protein phosphatase domain-containing protein n=1 Tax=Haemonchus contortus TaxID=6289 RepID=A0A7I4YMB5_HAECO
IVGVQAQGLDYRCCIFALSSTPNNFPWYDDLSMEIYKLERDVVDVKCHLAVDMFS